MNRPCPVCLGKGQVPTEPCPTCHGTGEVRVKRKVLINVPPGVDTGSKIRLKGQGGKGNANGPPGDLVITFNVLPDKFYRRDGLDVIATVPLNIAQATLGTKISVRTLDGKRWRSRFRRELRRGNDSACEVRESRRATRRAT